MSIVKRRVAPPSRYTLNLIKLYKYYNSNKRYCQTVKKVYNIGMKSIISNQYECLICEQTFGLHKHHIFGGSNRKWSEEDGLWVYLCPKHHNMSDEGVHFDKDIDLKLKKLGQRTYEKTHTRGEFMARYGKNWL